MAFWNRWSLPSSPPLGATHAHHGGKSGTALQTMRTSSKPSTSTLSTSCTSRDSLNGTGRFANCNAQMPSLCHQAVNEKDNDAVALRVAHSVDVQGQWMDICATWCRHDCRVGVIARWQLARAPPPSTELSCLVCCRLRQSGGRAAPSHPSRMGCRWRGSFWESSKSTSIRLCGRHAPKSRTSAITSQSLPGAMAKDWTGPVAPARVAQQAMTQTS